MVPTTTRPRNHFFIPTMSKNLVLMFHKGNSNFLIRQIFVKDFFRGKLNVLSTPTSHLFCRKCTNRTSPECPKHPMQTITLHSRIIFSLIVLISPYNILTFFPISDIFNLSFSMQYGFLGSK